MSTKQLHHGVYLKVKSLFSNLQIASDFFQFYSLRNDTLKEWLSGKYIFSYTEIKLLEDYFGSSMWDTSMTDDAHSTATSLAAKYRLREEIIKSLASQLEKISPPLFSIALEIIEHTCLISEKRRDASIQWLSEEDTPRKLVNLTSSHSPKDNSIVHVIPPRLLLVHNVITDLMHIIPTVDEYLEQPVLMVDDVLVKNICTEEKIHISKKGIATIIRVMRGESYDLWQFKSGNYYVVPSSYKEFFDISTFYTSIYDAVHHKGDKSVMLRVANELDKYHLRTTPEVKSHLRYFLNMLLQSEFNLKQDSEITFNPGSDIAMPLSDLVLEAMHHMEKPVILNSVYHYLRERYPALNKCRNEIYRALHKHPGIGFFYRHGNRWYGIKQFESEWQNGQNVHLIDKICEFIKSHGKPVHLDDIEKFLSPSYPLDQHMISVMIKSDTKRRCVFAGKGYYTLRGTDSKPIRNHRYTRTSGEYFKM